VAVPIDARTAESAPPLKKLDEADTAFEETAGQETVFVQNPRFAYLQAVELPDKAGSLARSVTSGILSCIRAASS
jgi:hypothetical protein